MDKATSVSDLLRMAKTIAVKLNLPDAMTWIDFELKGYSDPSVTPQYRSVRTHVRAYNPFYGWQEVSIRPDELNDAICNQQIFDGVPTIEHMLERVRSVGGTVGRALVPAAEDIIRKQMPVQLQLQA